MSRRPGDAWIECPDCGTKRPDEPNWKYLVCETCCNRWQPDRPRTSDDRKESGCDDSAVSATDSSLPNARAGTGSPGTTSDGSVAFDADARHTRLTSESCSETATADEGGHPLWQAGRAHERALIVDFIRDWLTKHVCEEPRRIAQAIEDMKHEPEPALRRPTATACKATIVEVARAMGAFDNDEGPPSEEDVDLGLWSEWPKRLAEDQRMALAMLYRRARGPRRERAPATSVERELLERSWTAFVALRACLAEHVERCDGPEEEEGKATCDAPAIQKSWVHGQMFKAERYECPEHAREAVDEQIVTSGTDTSEMARMLYGTDKLAEDLRSFFDATDCARVDTSRGTDITPRIAKENGK